MSRQAFSQSRHAFAQRFMYSSSATFSHSAAQAAHALAHDSQMVPVSGPCRETIFPAAVHSSAQSAQVPSVRRWSCLPAATKWAQC
jgi:hypothetical protein